MTRTRTDRLCRQRRFRRCRPGKQRLDGQARWPPVDRTSPEVTSLLATTGLQIPGRGWAHRRGLAHGKVRLLFGPVPSGCCRADLRWSPGQANPPEWAYAVDDLSYYPATDSWAPISQRDVPMPRSRHTAVWTGREMLVWGGITGELSPDVARLGDGGRYTPPDHESPQEISQC